MSTTTKSKILSRMIEDDHGFYKSLVDSMNEGVLLVDTDDIIHYCNEEFCALLGYNKENIIGRSPYDFFYNHVEEDWKRTKTVERSMNVSDSYEFPFRTKNGEKRWLKVSASPVRDSSGNFLGTLGIHSDITTHKIQEEYLEKISSEKDVLLKETHHRVKNNLQIISSLLSLQSHSIDEKESIKEILQTSQNRVKAMALLHEVIYKSDNLGDIQFTEYIKLLVNQLSNVLNTAEKGIEIVTHTKVNKLDLDAAVVCGMIINELVSNALEHAYKEKTEGGLISIKSLKLQDSILLVIRDNGCGLPQGFDFRESKTLGLQLVNALTDQLDGTIELDNSIGTEFRIEFPIK